MNRFKLYPALAIAALAALPFGPAQAQTTLNVATAGGVVMYDLLRKYREMLENA